MIHEDLVDTYERQMEDDGLAMSAADRLEAERWIQGFHLFMDGFPVTLCESAAQRRGWYAAKRSEWTLDCPAAALETMGV